MDRLRLRKTAAFLGTLISVVSFSSSAGALAADGDGPTPRSRASFPTRKVGSFSYDYALFSVGVEAGTTLGRPSAPLATVGPELAPIRYGLTTQSPSGWVLDADVKAGSFYLDLPGAVQPGFESEIIRTRVGGSLLMFINQDIRHRTDLRLKCSPATSADLAGSAYSKPAINGQLSDQDSETAQMALQLGPSWICNDANTYIEAMPFIGVGGGVRESDPTDPDTHLSAGLHAKLLRTDEQGLAKTLAILDAEHRWASVFTEDEGHSIYDVRAVFDQRITPHKSWMLGGEINLNVAPEAETPGAATAKIRASYAW